MKRLFQFCLGHYDGKHIIDKLVGGGPVEKAGGGKNFSVHEFFFSSLVCIIFFSGSA